MTKEKKIEKLSFDRDLCIINLEDKSHAIVVHAIDGSVTLCEGYGDDRIHGFVLTPSGVIRFEVEHIDGKAGISLLHWRQKKEARHFLGFVSNEKSAQAWVDRVNDIYKKETNERHPTVESCAETMAVSAY
ncbi:MAG: hypothetical protein SFH39_17950 [Candidatus Magnetobacterium sp. LHC-1]|nr:hypothetical protein [Nitrospirota bacterium]